MPPSFLPGSGKGGRGSPCAQRAARVTSSGSSAFRLVSGRLSVNSSSATAARTPENFLAPRPGIKRCRKHDFQFASYVISQLVDFEEGALEPRRGNFERPVGGEGVFHVEGETREPRQFRALIDGDALREQIVVGGLFGRGGFGAGKDVDVNPGDGAAAPPSSTPQTASPREAARGVTSSVMNSILSG